MSKDDRRPVPELRTRRLNAAEVRADAEYVLYWMTANRRTRWNFALERALELGGEDWEHAAQIKIDVDALKRWKESQPDGAESPAGEAEGR